MFGMKREIAAPGYPAPSCSVVGARGSTLRRYVGNEGVDRGAGIRRRELLGRGGRRDRDDHLHPAAPLGRDLVELLRLVAEPHPVGALGEPRVRADRLSAELV